MIKPKIALLLVAASTLVPAAQAPAAGVNRMPFEEQVREADLVVLAKPAPGLRRGMHRLDETGQLELTRMRVLRVLKGRSDTTEIYLVTKGEIAELNPGCCSARRSYILLLKQGRDNIFEAVNAQYSVIVVK